MESAKLLKATRSTLLNELYIDPEAMKLLMFDVQMSRKQRRKVARDNKWSWEVYRTVEREVTRRMRMKLNINTGKKDE